MKYCVENEIFGHLESIINGADRMTSGNLCTTKMQLSCQQRLS
jgi:hypothetical protein